MRNTYVDGFTRVNKTVAKRYFNEGNVIRVCPVNISPSNTWGLYTDLNRNTGVNFDEEINAFTYYNCNKKTGEYVAFYVTK